jgi:citrate/tricarballylate utilization protein
MRLDELTREGARVMAVCNACRYCEDYCPVFKAMELQRSFARQDLNYLANLCHNCGECLYACQYKPPHEFAINVPKTLARVRARSYAEYAWPKAVGVAYRHHGVSTALLFAAALLAVMLTAALGGGRRAALDPGTRADFYAVMPHWLMVALFGGVGLFVLVALAIGAHRCWRDVQSISAVSEATRRRGGLAALRDSLTLRHLHASGECVTAAETRTPWRRWLHHATFYGFALCFASTCVAALYHLAGWSAPYAYASVPVMLGTAGGVGLLVGPFGLLLQRRRRDAALSDPSHEALDRTFIVLLLLTSATGLILLFLRHTPAMGILLLVHLAVVLTLFLTLPYGKFVHGIYRAIALVKHSREGAEEGRGFA